MNRTNFSDHFGFNGHRSRLLCGLLVALKNLADAGCRSVLLNGSFVSNKELLEGHEGVWHTMGVNEGLSDPILLDFRHTRSAMKSKYQGELFPAGIMVALGVTYEIFFSKRTVTIPRKESFTLTLPHSHDYQRATVQDHPQEGGSIS